MADGGEDEEAHELPEGGDVEGFAAAKVARHPDAEDGGADVDAAENHGCYVGVVESDALEDGGAVVEEVILRKLVLWKGKYEKREFWEPFGGLQHREFLEKLLIQVSALGFPPSSLQNTILQWK